MVTVCDLPQVALQCIRVQRGVGETGAALVDVDELNIQALRQEVPLELREGVLP